MLIEGATAWAASKFAGSFAKAATVLALVAIGAIAAWLTVAKLDDMIEAADHRGEQRERHRWQAEIAVSNAKIAEAQLAADRAARAASDKAAGEIAALRKSLEDMERANAALPNGDACGLDRDRVRLLREQSGAGDPKR